MKGHTHKLMIKTHKVSKLKYLCYTRSIGKSYDNYKGSGTYWKSHLRKHGNDIVTELIYETHDKEIFKKVAIEKSLQYDIVNSKKWANLKIEEGDGGDTVSNKRWITNGKTDKYILKSDKLISGWKYGRTNCVFNNKKLQKELNSRVNIKNKIAGMKRAWADGKMQNRNNTNIGSRNKEEVVKEKISKALKGRSLSKSHKLKLKEISKNRPIISCPHCSVIGKGNIMKRWHFGNCKYK